jgi:hypothetical protein
MLRRVALVRTDVSEEPGASIGVTIICELGTTQAATSNRRTLRRNLVLHSKGFWRWCVTLITIKLLDFVHRPDFYKQITQRFGNWICFRLQARGEHLLYRKTKSLPFHRRCQKSGRWTKSRSLVVMTFNYVTRRKRISFNLKSCINMTRYLRINHHYHWNILTWRFNEDETKRCWSE